MWNHPRGHVWNVFVRPASSWGATGRSGTPCRQSRGVDPPVQIRRGEKAQRRGCWKTSVFLSRDTGISWNLRYRSLKWKVPLHRNTVKIKGDSDLKFLVGNSLEIQWLGLLVSLPGLGLIWEIRKWQACLKAQPKQNRNNFFLNYKHV